MCPIDTREGNNFWFIKAANINDTLGILILFEGQDKALKPEVVQPF